MKSTPRYASTGLDSEKEEVHGRSFVTEDNLQFLLGREEVKRLCSWFAEGIIDEWQLQYIANAID
jgi:hypothetical protein